VLGDRNGEGRTFSSNASRSLQQRPEESNRYLPPRHIARDSEHYVDLRSETLLCFRLGSRYCHRLSAWQQDKTSPHRTNPTQALNSCSEGAVGPDPHGAYLDTQHTHTKETRPRKILLYVRIQNATPQHQRHSPAQVSVPTCKTRPSTLNTTNPDISLLTRIFL